MHRPPPQPPTRQCLNAVRDVWRCLPDLVRFDLLFSLLTAGLMSPLIAVIFQSFIASTGQSAIGNFDLVPFLLQPVAFGFCIAIATLTVALSVLRLAGLMYLGAGALKSRRIHYSHALRFAGIQAFRVTRFSLALVLLVLLLFTPLLVTTALLAKHLLGRHDINYYLHERPPESWIAVAIVSSMALITVAFMVLGVPYVVAGLGNVVCRDEAGFSALGTTRGIMRNRVRSSLHVLLTWLAVWFVCSLLANLLVHGTAWFLVDYARDRVHLLVSVLGGITVVQLLVNYFLAFFGYTVLSSLMVRLYHEACEFQGLVLALPKESGTELPERRRWKLSGRRVLGLAFVAAAVIVGVSIGLLQNITLDDRVEISAHRGSSLAAPENSLSAFRQAIEDGADYLELDVQRTTDDVLVIVHDADLMRVAGAPLVISQSSYAQLAEVDLGKKFGPRFAGERVPTLDEVIAMAKGRVKLLVELKSYRGDAKTLVARVVGTLRNAHLLSDSVVMSLKYDELQEVTRLAPTVRTAFLASTAVGDLSKLNVNCLAVSHSLATDLLIGSAHAREKQIYVWTIDKPKVASLMIDRGVDNIITNDPAAVARVLAERAVLTTPERVLLRFRNLYERQ